MKLYFEEYAYPEALLRQNLGSEVDLTPLNAGRAKIPYVGYYFNSQINDSVFILPKVFISENGKAFNRYNPEKIIDISPDNNPLHNDDYADDKVVFELSAWLYRAINHFFERNRESGIGREVHIQNVRPSGEKLSKTIIEIILSLCEFHKRHRNLFTYIAIVNASGNNKVHWTKTVRKVQPVFQNDTPYYLKFQNKNKVIDFDEELISLFYSVLHYLNDTYHFKMQDVQGYTLLKPARIKSMIESGKGTRFLKKIRRNYFTDELVQLWNLLYEFFDRAEMVASGRPYHEKLLVNNFNLIFEDMVDQIISDKDVPTELKEQKDGKIVDHLYRAQSIVEAEKQIYYIGDSKYYKESNNVGENSNYKQFTYAKNVIQHNINLFNEKRLPDYFRYRDDLTEGYNITPNFFIRGIIDFENPDNQDFSFKKDNAFMPTNCHFLNRLFDRDTLFLQSYDINFMFVVASYVRNSDDASLKQKLKKTFRDDFVDFLSDKFKFSKLTPRDGDLKSAVERNFRNLIGKIYKPTDADYLILAFEKKYEEDYEKLETEIKADFEIADYQLDKLTAEVRHISYNQLDEPLPIAAEPTATYSKNSQLELNL